jgi:hypothetical protein
VEWAPATVLSHLQEYINTMTHDTGLTHTGVTFAVECILCFSGQSDQVEKRFCGALKIVFKSIWPDQLKLFRVN